MSWIARRATARRARSVNIKHPLSASVTAWYPSRSRHGRSSMAARWAIPACSDHSDSGTEGDHPQPRRRAPRCAARTRSISRARSSSQMNPRLADRDLVLLRQAVDQAALVALHVDQCACDLLRRGVDVADHEAVGGLARNDRAVTD